MSRVDHYWLYLVAGTLFALNLALLFVPFLMPVRLVTALAIIFFIPGVFIVRIVLPDLTLESIEGIVMAMVISVAVNTLVLFALNVLAHVPFADLPIFFAMLAQGVFFAAADFLLRKRGVEPPRNKSSASLRRS